MRKSDALPSGSAPARVHSGLVAGGDPLFANDLRRIQRAAQHPNVIASGRLRSRIETIRLRDGTNLQIKTVAEINIAHNLQLSPTPREQPRINANLAILDTEADCAVSEPIACNLPETCVR